MGGGECAPYLSGIGNMRRSMKKIIATLKGIANNKIVLIVEDDQLVIDSLVKLLSTFFTEIYYALTVTDAIITYKKLLKENSPIIVITDINLGQESGIDLTLSLKEINSIQKVIAISGTEDRQILIEAIRCEVDRFILKPINQKEFFSGLIDVLQKVEYDLKLEANYKLLKDSKEYTVKLLEEQDQFLQNAIHEMNTPLAIIITNIDLLRIDGINNESFNSIEAGARIIHNSYEDMTYLMKHHRITHKISKINLVKFISKRIEYFKCIAIVNNLVITIRVGQPEIPLIQFSEYKLLRLIDNTLSNAIKYSYRPSEISVRVGVRKGKVFFEIRNFGPIISDIEKIFKRFYRESKDKGGYGLGLNIVSQICNEEKVTIEVSSNTARGTCFCYIFNTETLLQHYSSIINEL